MNMEIFRKSVLYSKIENIVNSIGNNKTARQVRDTIVNPMKKVIAKQALVISQLKDKLKTRKGPKLEETALGSAYKTYTFSGVEGLDDGVVYTMSLKHK